MDKIGYFNDETGVTDLDYAARIFIGTDYKHAFVPEIIVDETQKIECEECAMRNRCLLDKDGCFNVHDNNYKHLAFFEERGNILHQYIYDIKSGKRDIYCASIHDESSMKNHYYNREVALETIKYFIDNGN